MTAFSAPIVAAIGRLEENASDWTCDERPDAWVVVTHALSVLVEQGWKLHVSATIVSADDVLRRALPVLLAERAPFKVCRSTAQLRRLNSGLDSLSQVGKFITVYPADDEAAVRIASALDRATAGLRGPAVPSDRALHANSIVHYRYGGFGDLVMQTRTGEVIAALRDPSGALVPDRRTISYVALEWTRDPFLTSGIAEAEAVPEPLIGGRYLVSGELYRSARGTVSYGVDLQEPRLCILKTAIADALVDSLGKNACDRLRHEFETLQRLTDSRFPYAIRLLEHGGALTAVFSETNGKTLERRMLQVARNGQHLPTQQIAVWGRALAQMLGVVHAAGLVYRDLKSTNVLVTPHDELKLIDFELACDVGVPAHDIGVGTRGYTSPQQTAGEPAAIQDDIYGLGALLAYMATNAEPSHAPCPGSLLDRPLERLRPGLDPRLQDVIRRCLAHDRGHRYATTAAVEDALDRIIADPRAASEVRYGSERRDEVDEDAALLRSASLTRSLADAICASAERYADGARWMSRHPVAYGARARDINAGTAGIVLALAELVDEFGDAAHERVLRSAADGLARGAMVSPDALPGLYVGEAGVAAALLRAGQILGSAELIAAALARADALACIDHRSPDLFNGSAGRLRVHLLLWDETQSPAQLEHAHAAAAALLASARRSASDGWSWAIPSGYGALDGNVYLGYAHGIAGIGDTLLDLFEVTGDHRYAEAVSGALRSLQRCAVPALADESGLNWPVMEGGERAMPFWCHGAAGIGRFLLRAASARLSDDAAELAHRAVVTTARGSRWTNPTLCHGLAGSIELLIDAYQATGLPAHRSEAISLGELLQAFALSHGSLTVVASELPATVTPDYNVGYAGVATALLRLVRPRDRPTVLSRAGFRYRCRGTGS